ncbi:MAG: subfamily HAD-superfamily phosphatase, partial [Cohnella sp.]|nr:subfamily HAD-superfamily phosphatase [Cohnella sp.]
QVIAGIQRRWGKTIPLTTLFASPTIRELAQAVEAANPADFPGIESLPERAVYPAASAQKRLLMLAALDPNNVNYNISMSITIAGPLDRTRFQYALDQLIRRHASLRTEFAWNSGQPVQQIQTDMPFHVIDLEATDDTLNEVIDRFVQPFSVYQAPLFRCGLVTVSEHRHVWLLDMHHAVSDGLSMRVLLEDFSSYYQGRSLPPLRIQYGDYAVWQQNRLNSPDMQQQRAYWQEMLQGGVPLLHMPCDNPRPQRRQFAGNRVQFSIPSDLVNEARRFAGQQGATLQMVLSGAYAVLLNQYTDDTDFMVGTLVAGRSQTELEDLAGVFINFLPIRWHIRPDQTLESFFQYARDLLLKAYDHQDYPFDEMVQMAQTQDASRNPLYDTMLVFHSERESLDIVAGELTLEGREIDRGSSTLDFKLDIYARADGELVCYLEYDTALFKQDTMVQFGEAYIRVLIEALAKPTQPLRSLKALTSEQMNWIEASRTREAKAGSGTQALPVVVSATFTADFIQDTLCWWGKQWGEELQLRFAPYNQVFQELLNPESVSSANTGVNLILARFEDWMRDLGAEEIADGGKMTAYLRGRYEEWLDVLLRKEKNIPYFVGVFPVSPALFNDGVRACLEDLYQEYKSHLKTQPNLYVIDFSVLPSLYGISDVFDPVRDKEGHAPYTEVFYRAMGTSVARNLMAYRRQHFKVIAVDADHTLWSGVCGEDGPLGVTVDGPYALLQSWLKQKTEEGFLLALCSKNDIADVNAVFETNPGMILRPEHFVIRRVNWRKKSENLKEMAAALNVGLDSFIFMDDNPVECSEMMAHCPQVLTLQLPAQPDLIPWFLNHLWATDRLYATAEDSLRNEMYRREQQRQDEANSAASLEAFFQGLKLKLRFAPMTEEEVGRFAQMTQRTNQFNLSAKRRTEQDIRSIAAAGYSCFVVEVRDRLGDYGLVGAVIARTDGDTLDIDSFLLSCRVLGRQIEDAVITALGRYARQRGIQSMAARYYPTDKNQPMRNFLESRWTRTEEADEYTGYRIDISDIPEQTPFVELYEGHRQMQFVAAKTVVDGKAEVPVGHLRQASISPDIEQIRQPAVLPLNIGTEPVNEQNLIHRHHLLPLRYTTGEALMDIAFFDGWAERNIQTEYTAPMNEREHQLLTIAEEVLRVRRLGVTDDFFASGGHSLQALQFASTVYAKLGIQLTLEEIYQYPSVRQLANRFSIGQTFSSDKQEPMMRLTAGSARPIDGNEHTEQTLFCFPPLGGFAFTFREFAQHLEPWQVYGFDFIADENRLNMYREHIQAIQPVGPYTFVAYSAGVLLAYEMALLFEGMGHEVSRLILLDSYKPGYQGLNYAAGETRDPAVWDREELVPYLLNSQLAVGEYLATPNIRQRIELEVQRYAQYYFSGTYERRLQTQIHWIRAEGAEMRSESDVWIDITTGSVFVYEGAGTHFDMLREGFADINAGIVRSILNRSLLPTN